MTIESLSTETHNRDRAISAITKALTAILNRPLGPVTAETRLFDELGLDSTGALDLVMNLEEDLGIEFYTENLEFTHFATVGALADFVLPELER